MKITQLAIRNYRGVEALSTRVPPGGLMVLGPNGAGKTGILDAIRAALAGRDIGADAIRIGTDRCEILVNLDDVAVKRVITGKGSRLSVEAADGRVIKAPQTWLNDLLGTSPLDPIDMIQAKPKDQKAMVLAALPIRVSAEQVQVWLDGWPLDRAPDLTLHGLEVIDLIRKEFATKRTDANAVAKEIEKGIAALEAGAPPAVPGALPVAEAEQKQRAASAALAEIEARRRRVEEQAAKTQGTRDRAAKLRADAAAWEAAPAPDPTVLAKLEAEHRARGGDVKAWRERIAELEGLITAARETLLRELEAEAFAADRVRSQRSVIVTDEAGRAQAVSLREQADSLESAIAATLEVDPTADEIATAQLAEQRAEVDRVAAIAGRQRAEHEATVAAERTKLTRAHEAAGQLAGMVEKFTKVVPNELLKSANGIPGLALDGDEVFLDGVRLSSLSGREQLLFAVQISRRLNVQAKILIVDGLERVDDDLLPDFVKAATADGYQLVATRVKAGEVVLEAIELEGDA